MLFRAFRGFLQVVQQRNQSLDTPHVSVGVLIRKHLVDSIR